MEKLKTRYSIQWDRVIYGFPSTGKSEFVRRQEEAGAYLLDTDELFKLMFPKFWATTKDPLGRSRYTGRNGSLADAARWWIGNTSRKFLSQHPRGVLTTNLWGATFRKGLGVDDSMPLGFARASATDALSVLTERDGAHKADPKVVSMWHRAVITHGPSIFKHFVLLGKDEFISDYLSLGPSFLDVAERPAVEQWFSELWEGDSDLSYITVLDDLLSTPVRKTGTDDSVGQESSES